MAVEAEDAPGDVPALRVAVVAGAGAEALSAQVSALGYTLVSPEDADIVLAPAGTDAAALDATLRAAAAGLSLGVPENTAPAFAAMEDDEAPVLLTPRELEILVLLSDGMSNKSVARALDISQHTVKFHVESIFRKLGVASRAEAVAKGLKRGLMHL